MRINNKKSHFSQSSLSRYLVVDEHGWEELVRVVWDAVLGDALDKLCVFVLRHNGSVLVGMFQTRKITVLFRCK